MLSFRLVAVLVSISASAVWSYSTVSKPIALEGEVYTVLFQQCPWPLMVNTRLAGIPAVGWAGPAAEHSPSCLPTLLPHSRVEERIRRVKPGKLVTWDKDSLISEIICAPKQIKIRLYSLLPISRQMFRHFLESRAPSCVMVTWKDKSHNQECLDSCYLLLLTFAQVFIVYQNFIWHGISLWSAGVSCPVCLFTNSCLTPILLSANMA